SAGNEGAGDEPHIGVPAEATNVLAIGAVRANRLYASFSSIGPSFDGRIKPDVMAQGKEVSVADPQTGDITITSGTSVSGPIIAGMIATFWSAVPDMTNQQVVNFVKQSADKFANPNNQYGYGIPDFQLALNNALLATQQFSNGTSFIVYPNPAAAKTNVAFPNGIQDAQISFYNTLGQIVGKQNISGQNTVVSLESLHSGVYLYKIESGTFSQSGKMIIK
ncbi:MAG TPA: S8 family serine peptidase, partial [Flavobacterium sp.]|nr:S8 family serine peptidase [Flavobacterium sp.]